MDNLDIKNLQLSYLAIYDENLCESMEELGLIGEARDGYGDDSKFNKPDDKIEKPGTTVPKPKKGGYGRISRATPYGIGAHANRTASRVTTIVGEDPGAPRAEKMAKETSTKKSSGKKMVKKDGKWVKEAQDYYDSILSHLIDDDYTTTVESVAGDIATRARKLSRKRGQTPKRKKIYKDLADLATQRANPQPEANWRTGISDTSRKMRVGSDPYVDPDNVKLITTNPKKLRKQRAIGEIQDSYDYYDIILSHLLDEGYASTIENAEAIMVNMSEDWVNSIING